MTLVMLSPPNGVIRKNPKYTKKTVASGVIGDPQRDRQSISLFFGCYGNIYTVDILQKSTIM
jgi:hypothetical protein